MSNALVSRCPICSQRMEVTRLHCRSCHTSMEGSFEPCKFCQLNPRQREFVEVFLASRGNIKEVERLLGISYPTVRSRLDAVIEAMGYHVERDSSERKDILEALHTGEISSEEAIKLLQKRA